MKRIARRQDGIFGVLLDGTLPFAVTLEHAFADQQGGWRSVIPAGTYACKRGIHRLSSGGPFETFEVTGVEGHSGLLFHRGNVNQDSSGCILTGESFQVWKDGSCAVMRSGLAFGELMDRMRGMDIFTLTVVEA